MSETCFKVLVADDEYWIRENLRGLLDWQQHSFEFLEPVEDGEQAIAAIYEQRPDIVITDVNMPFISGTELIEIIHAELPEIIFIALSGYSDYDYVRTALVAGAVDYLLKPISKADLLKILHQSVSRIVIEQQQKQAQREVQEKLRASSSLIMDKELSQLIHRTSDKQRNEAVKMRLAEYELDFAGFTLVLIRTAGLSRILRQSGEKEPDALIFKIKETIQEHALKSRSLVFNNTYKSNEFLFITDVETSLLGNICARLIASLEDLTGFPVFALIGRHYFSFLELRSAYNAALMALLAHEFTYTGGIIYVSEAQDCLTSKRMNSEQENRLLFAAKSCNREQFQSVLFDEIKLLDCDKNAWRFVEVRQTAESVAFILRNSLASDTKPVGAKLLTLDHLAELLQLAVDDFDTEEMRFIIEQMLDEFFGLDDHSNQGETMRQTVTQVKNYVDQNYFEDLSLTMLSQRFLAESSYLSKVFKASTGDNLMLYIAKRRIERAQEYLKQGKMSITEIAHLVGYGDYAYFSRVFRKITGISPREFKEGVFEAT